MQEESVNVKARPRFQMVIVVILFVFIAIVAISVTVFAFFMPVIKVSGSSMEPEYNDGDILLLIKSDNYERGQICCIKWQNKLLLRRVIGVSGDMISIDENGNVSVNDIPLDEPYVTNKCLGECDITFPYKVPEGKIFVLGDHRDLSVDSRSYAVGCVDSEQLLGKVLLRLWKG